MDKNRDDVMCLLKLLGFKYIPQKGAVQQWMLRKGNDAYVLIYHTDRYYYDLHEKTRDVTFKSIFYTKDAHEAYNKLHDIFKIEYRKGIINKLLENDK